MKKFLPLILLGVGIIVVIGVFLVIRTRNVKENQPEEETALLNVPLNERPVVSLTPTSDGHYLNLKVEKIVLEAETLEYELLYKVPNGVPQGVPGSVSILGKESFEVELLLGSESSGKFRYDEGVEEGTMTLRFRNSDGELLAKFISDFHLQTDVDTLTSLDGKLSVSLDKTYQNFFVVIESIGVPDTPPQDVKEGPYAIFSSDNDTLQLSGSVIIQGSKVYRHVAGPRWTSENTNTILDSETGIFIGTSE